MSSKKKSAKSGWIETASGHFMLETFIDGNSSYSFSEASHEPTSVFPKFPIIVRGLLCGEVSRKLKEIKLPEHVIQSAVFVHPETMMKCNMKISDPVLVIEETCHLICRVWPSTHLPLGKVAFSDNVLSVSGMEVGRRVLVTAPPHGINVAGSISFLPLLKEKDEMNIIMYSSKHFLNYLSGCLEHTYAAVGQKVELYYFGRRFLFEVDTVQIKETNDASSQDITYSSINDSDVITKGIEHISFNSNGQGDKSVNQSMGKLMTSTPLKGLSSQSLKSDSLNAETVKDLRLLVEQHLVYVITSKTKVSIDCQNSEPNSQVVPKQLPVMFSDIGGLVKQIEVLKDLVVAPAKNPIKYKNAGIQPLHALLLHGLPKTGKSLLARALANEVGGFTKTIRGSEIISRYLGESEEKLRSVFAEARSKPVSLILIDEIDALCPRRDSTRTDAEKRVVGTFAAMLDGREVDLHAIVACNKALTGSGGDDEARKTIAECKASLAYVFNRRLGILNNTLPTSICSVLPDINDNPPEGYVVVIATTNRLEAVDPELRRAGRFEREIEVSAPSVAERSDILQKILSKTPNSLSLKDIQDLSKKCHGYVGGDLAAVCKEAGLLAVKKAVDDDVTITLSDLEYGLKQVPPSAMREMTVHVPKVYWSDIGGNDVVKRKLKEAIELPLQHPEAFMRLGIEPPRGVLLYGPPGCSKTLTAKALATESGLNFISIKGPELFSKYVGESERAIRRVFAKAKSAAPSIVFFDELDAVAVERGGENTVANRVLATLLTEMDGVVKRDDVMVVAATNRPDMIDKAFLRPGRIDRILYVPLPDSAARREIFQILFRKMPISSDVDVDQLVERTEMYSGAEVCSVCREAALATLQVGSEALEIGMPHFEVAMRAVLPQTTIERAKMYERYQETLQAQIK